MKLLGIDSSGLVASVALVFDDVMIAEYTTNFKKTHSQTLLPMIDEMLTMTGVSLADIDAIAVAAGPGSFTGLRIGSSTAKGLGLALNKPIIPVKTVEGLAYNLYGTNKRICPIMDARRNQVYTGIYRMEGEELVVLSNQRAVDIESLIEELNQNEDPVIFLGDGVPVYKDSITRGMKTAYQFAPAHLAMQRAGALCKRAQILFQQGIYESAGDHKPDYLRLSQAERERNEKMQPGVYDDN
ncbi:MAG: tRNA threonylcarbamoyladenosine biosynthesis protein TsaB [Clostridiales bacterium]|nr:tRNA threonylcarbamoyladenosine biosynthesis protein TsaB [Clostridiales bacterium]